MLCDVLGRQIIDKLKTDLSLVSTLDAYLVKISSLILYLKDMCKLQDDINKCVNICLESILTHFEIIDHVKLLSCYYGDVHNEVSTSPRYKLIKSYWNTVGKILKTLPCKSWKSLSRTPIYPKVEEVEKLEQEYTIPVRVTTRNKRKASSKFYIVMVIAAVSILLLLLYKLLAS